MAGVKYHINPETGRPNKCTATVRGCAYSRDGMVPEHYDSKEEAQEAYENQNKEKTFNSLSKNRQKPSREEKVSQSSESVSRGYSLTKDEELNNVQNYRTPSGRIISTSKDVEKMDQDKVIMFTEEIVRNLNRVRGNYGSYDYSSDGIAGIAGYTADDYGVRFDEGSYYHPTPDEEYHGGDISYTTEPSFTVRDREKFTHEVLKGVLGEDFEVNENMIEDLHRVGFFNGDNYTAAIENHYYGDELNGFIANSSMANDVGEIAAIHRLLQDQ